MKRTALMTVTLLAGCLAGHSQITLSAGDRYVYEFSTLSPAFELPFGAPMGSFGFSITPGTLQTGDLLQWEMFENSPSGDPLFTGYYSSDSPQDNYGVYGAWQDLQGSVRFTMLSGSVGLDWLNILATVPRGFDPPMVYQAIVTPVPEPCSITLFLSGAGLLGGRYFRRLIKTDYERAS
jgi:hypothetical protein